MTTLIESASLFEVNIPEYKQLRQCRRELILLKTLWDFVYTIRASIDDWKTTLWRQINVEQMDVDCRRFSKDVRQFKPTLIPLYSVLKSYVQCYHSSKKSLATFRLKPSGGAIGH